VGLTVEPYRLTLAEAAGCVARREVAPSELLESVLARIEAVDGEVGAFVGVAAGRAREVARAADRDIARDGPCGPLHGIPVAMKDLYDLAGQRTGAGSRARDGHVAGADSGVAERLRAAGANLFGKVRTHEFAYGSTTPGTRNPWTLRHIPGGSSGGSGAAVAARMCFASMGTDTGGSVRGPAAHCGVVGLKPTYGRVPVRGVVPLAWSQDHAGPLARTVTDVALMLNAVAGHDPGDPASADHPVPDFAAGHSASAAGLVVGVPVNHFFDDCHPDVAAAAREAITVLRDAGADVREVEVPLAGEILAAHYTILAAEATAYHDRALRRDGHGYGEAAAAMLHAGRAIRAVDYIQAQRLRTEVVRRWREVFRTVDVLVAPTVSAPAARYGEDAVAHPDGRRESVLTAYARLNFPADFTGLPALSVPCGFAREGVPVGIQIIGRPFEEATVLRAGYAYESATDWWRREPPL
jgi:aspartyl-tRNA(Asn)/glutamyl-tRNA(Gln) amidotransferase subunit A